MTRKHYIAIASIINDYVQSEKRGNVTMSNLAMLELITIGLAKIMRNDNPLFDNDKFFKACGFDN